MTKAAKSKYQPVVGDRITRNLSVVYDKNGKPDVTDLWGPRRGTFVDEDGQKFFLYVPPRGCLHSLNVSATVRWVTEEGVVVLSNVRLKKS